MQSMSTFQILSYILGLIEIKIKNKCCFEALKRVWDKQFGGQHSLEVTKKFQAIYSFELCLSSFSIVASGSCEDRKSQYRFFFVKFNWNASFIGLKWS